MSVKEMTEKEIDQVSGGSSIYIPIVMPWESWPNPKKPYIPEQQLP